MEDPLPLLLLGLEVLPAVLDLAGRVQGAGGLEDVGMATDELLVDPARDLRKVSLPALLEEQRQEVHLEEEVAELVEELGVVVSERRFGDLVGLLDRVGDDRARRLRGPRDSRGAAARQALAGRREPPPSLRGRHPCSVAVVSPVVCEAGGAKPGA